MEDDASVRRNTAELRLAWQWLVTALAMRAHHQSYGQTVFVKLATWTGMDTRLTLDRW